MPSSTRASLAPAFARWQTCEPAHELPLLVLWFEHWYAWPGATSLQYQPSLLSLQESGAHVVAITYGSLSATVCVHSSSVMPQSVAVRADLTADVGLVLLAEGTGAFAADDAGFAFAAQLHAGNRLDEGRPRRPRPAR